MQGNNSPMPEVKGLIFDFGGTLDTQGRHWFNVLWDGLCRCGLTVSKDDFRNAYIYGERTLGREKIVKPDFSFYETLRTKMFYETEYLIDNSQWKASEEERSQVCQNALDFIYSDVKATASHSLQVLKALRRDYTMALVTNFYGNMKTVISELGLGGLFEAVVESAVVGVRKPDPEIFQKGVDALRLLPEEVAVVGDSMEKDILPAMKTGCKTIWLKGESWDGTQPDEGIADMTITSLDQLL